MKVVGSKEGKEWRVQVAVVRKGFCWGWNGVVAGDGDDFVISLFDCMAGAFVDGSGGAALNVSARVELGRRISVAMPRLQRC